MYHVTIFGINITLNPVAFTIPIGSGWQVYWYGIIIALGFLLAVLYGFYTAPRYNLNKDKIMDGVLIVAPVAVLCARIYYLLFDGEKLTSIKDFFGFSNGQGFSGLAIYGAVIGAVLAAIAVCKLFKLNILDVLDITSVGFLIGQAVGRWGNFINQEAYGTFTGSTFWGMTSERTVRELGLGLVHPCFLYESVWCILGFFLLNYFSKRRKFSGQIVLMYCTWYGLGRAIIELMRTDSLMIGRFRVSFLLSLLIALFGAVMLIVVLRKKVKPVMQQYAPLFADAFDQGEEETENLEDADSLDPANQDSDAQVTVDTEEEKNGTDN